MDEYASANRLNWDNRAELHASDTTGSYRIAKVLAGGSSLHALEASEIGDVSGKDIVHLQCHIGLDTISLKHLGAKSVTGLDFSPKAIAAARDFAERAGAEVRFVRGVGLRRGGGARPDLRHGLRDLGRDQLAGRHLSAGHAPSPPC